MSACTRHLPQTAGRLLTIALLTTLVTLGPLASALLAQGGDATRSQEPAADPPVISFVEEYGLVGIPFPELEGLERDVAEQLTEVKKLVQGVNPRGGAVAAGTTMGELGQVYHAYGFEQSALACYYNATRMSPEDYRWYHLMGHLLQTGGELEQARDAYRNVLQLQPDYVATKVRLAEVEIGLGELESARTLLESALEQDGTLAAAQGALGELALVEGRHQEVVDRLDSLLAAVPGANRFHYPLATAYRALGNVDKAREHLAKRGEVGVKPPDPLVDSLDDLKRGERVYLLRGRRAFSAKRYAEAAVAFAEAVASDPKSVRARVNLATALAEAGAPKAAVDELLRAIELEPQNPTAYFNLGGILADQGRLDQALAALRKAVQLDPSDTAARLALARLARNGGIPSEALLHASSVVRSNPENEDAQLLQGTVLVDLGRYADAIQALGEANELLPQAGRIAHVLARLLAAVPDPTLRDGDRALNLALRVHQAESNLEHAETVALALAASGDCPKAIEWQEQIVTAAEGAKLPNVERLRATLEAFRSGAGCAAPSP